MMPRSKLLKLKGDARTDLTVMAHHLMQLFGGPEGLAEHLFADIKKATPGSTARLNAQLAVANLLERFAADDDELPQDEDALEALARNLAIGGNGQP